jgi:hypothetical protein
VRPIPHLCEYIEGERYDGQWGGGLHLIYCKRQPESSFSVLGISPLFVCRAHCKVLRQSLIYYVDEIVIEKLMPVGTGQASGHLS